MLNQEYEISNNGQLRRVADARIFNAYRNKRNGYYYISVRVGDKAYCKRIHRLVAIAFIPNPNSLEDVNHLDGNKANNTVGNLEWCTRSRNILHAYDIGLRNRKKIKNKRGPSRKNTRSKKVRQLSKQGELIATFNSLTDAEAGTGIYCNNIRDVCIGKRVAAGDFKWEFIS